MNAIVVPHPPEFVERYRQSGVWPDETLIEQWTRVAEAHPDRDAVVAPDGRVTYAELAVATDRIAAGLADLGLEPGERVLFQVTNRLGAALAWYGVLKAGLVPVCTLAAHRHHEIEAIGARSGAAAHLVEALTHFDMHDFAAQMATAVPTLRVQLTVGAAPGASGVRIEDLAADGDAALARKRVAEIQSGLDPTDVAVLQLSGGTTGTPKLIPRLHHEYWYNGLTYARTLGWDSSVRVAHVLPLIHNAGITCALHAAHSVGGATVLLPPDPTVVLDALAAEGVTDILLGTAMAGWAAAMVAGVPSLRRVVIAGAKPPEGMVETFERGGVWAGQLYGMAEGFYAMTPLDAPSAVRLHSVGVPMSSLDEIAILRARDREAGRRRRDRRGVCPRALHDPRLLRRASRPGRDRGPQRAGVHRGRLLPHRRPRHGPL